MKLLLFGAGASIPFYPSLTTNYITEQILTWDNWERIIRLYNERSEYKINYEHLLTFLKNLKAQNTSANFEEICGCIDLITNVFTDLGQNGYNKFDKTTNALLNCNIFELKSAPIKNIKYLPYLYRCLITDILLGVSKNIIYDNLICQQQNFIKTFIEKEEKVSIVSLNYDNVLNESIGNIFYNGFDRNRQDIMPFSLRSFFQADKTISYLHGNVKFYYSLPDVQYSFEETLNTSERIEKLFLKRNLNEQHLISNVENHSYNVFIITGIEKNISMDYSPYNAYYTKFASDVCKSSSIISIGYSFKDEHVNRILSSFLNIDIKNKVVIVDFNTENDVIIDDLVNPRNILYDIYRVFLCKITINNSQEIKNINTIGYGFITEQILYYKKGYESFLSEYKEVIAYFNNHIIKG